MAAATMPKDLPRAPLGKDGPLVTRLGFGAMGLSQFYGKPKPDPERLAVLDRAYADGATFWDTSDVYGDNELLIGEWFKRNPEKRDHIFLATKFAAVINPDGTRSVENSPEHTKKSCNKSLGRLGIKCIDLYYIHRLDGKTPIEKTIQAMVELKNEGKIKHIGISECSASALRRAYAVHPIAAVQMEYSPFALEIEQDATEFLKTCRELGVAVVAYSPIGRGLISGAIRSRADFGEGDSRLTYLPRFSEENFPKNLELADKFRDIAQKKGVTATQLALAWLMAQGDDIFPIPGTTKPERLDENVGSVSIKLTASEEKDIRKICEEAEIHGTRYPEAFMAACFADSPPLE